MHDHVAVAPRIDAKAALWAAFIARGRAVGMAIGLGAVFGLVVYLVKRTAAARELTMKPEFPMEAAS